MLVYRYQVCKTHSLFATVLGAFEYDMKIPVISISRAASIFKHEIFIST